MTNAAIGWQNVVKAAATALSASSAALPVSNLTIDQGAAAVGWQSAAGDTSPYVLLDSGTALSTWQAFGIFRTNLSPAATVRFRVGPAETVIEAVPAWSTDWTIEAPTPPPGLAATRASIGYAFDNTGTLVSNAVNVLRQQHDPVTHKPIGALVEGSTTNTVRNPRAEGAAAGTPGTAPTNWSVGAGGGASTQIVGTGVESGIPYADVRVYGTSAGGNLGLYVETGTCPGATGQKYTFSAFTRLIAGTLANVLNLAFILDEKTSALAFILNTNIGVSLPSAAGLASQRQAATFLTHGGSTTANLGPWLYMGLSAGAVDFTIRVGAPQLEQSTVASSPVLPTPGSPGATSRSPDVFLVNWTAPTSGFGLYSDVTPFGSTADVLLSVSAGSNFAGSCYAYWDGASINNTVLGGAAGGTGSAGAALSSGTSVKSSITASPTFVECDNSASAAAFTTTGGALLGYNQIAIGGASWGGGSGTTGVLLVRKLSAYGFALSNNQTLALSASGSSMTATGLAYDSGAVAGVVPGYGQAVTVAPAAVTGEFCRCDISDPTNSDGFVNVSLMYAGPVFTPATNIAWSSAPGRKDLTVEAVTRGGQEYPRPQWQQRHYKMDLQGVRTSEVWSVIDQLDGSARQGGNILCVPVPGAATVNQEAVFGRLTTTTDITRPFGNGDRLAYTGTFVERL